MATARILQPGILIDHTPSGNVAAGDVVIIGTSDSANAFIGIAASDIAANALGAVDCRGIARLPKATTSTSALAVGTVVYWNNSSETVVTTNTETPLGKVAKAAGASDATVDVLLTA
jgi:predicted RecA/RadA family phage recombinase